MRRQSVFASRESRVRAARRTGPGALALASWLAVGTLVSAGCVNLTRPWQLVTGPDGGTGVDGGEGGQIGPGDGPGAGGTGGSDAHGAGDASDVSGSAGVGGTGPGAGGAAGSSDAADLVSDSSASGGAGESGGASGQTGGAGGQAVDAAAGGAGGTSRDAAPDTLAAGGSGGRATGGAGSGGRGGRGGAASGGSGGSGSGGKGGSGSGGAATGGSGGSGGSGVPDGGSACSSQGLVAYYPCEQAAGTVLPDLSGLSNSATLVTGTGGSTGYGFAAGKVGNALDLVVAHDGYAQLPAGLLSKACEVTVATWVYVNNNVSWQRIFDFGRTESDGTSNVYMYLTAQDGTNQVLRFAISTTGNGGEQAMSGPALTTRTWYHVAVVLGAQGGFLYVNGAQVAANPAITLRPTDLSNPPNYYIGRSQWTHDPYFDGDIDEFRVYDRALSPQEIQTLANGS